MAYAGLSMAGGAILAERTAYRQKNPIGEPDRRRAADVARPYGARVDDVRLIASDGADLRGWQFTPAMPNGHAVVLLHSVGGNRMSSLGLAELFLSRGYTALTADARAHGESGGRVAAFGALEADDIGQWVRRLAADRPDRCVYLMGVSLGGGHALQASGVPELCGVIAQSGYMSLREVVFDRVGQQLGSGDWVGRTVLRPGLEFAVLYTRLRFGVNYGAASAYHAVSGTGPPILIIHGSEDDNVPPRHAELVRATNPGRVTVWMVPNAGHNNVWGAAGAEYGPRIMRFLETHRQRAWSGGAAVR